MRGKLYTYTKRKGREPRGQELAPIIRDRDSRVWRTRSILNYTRVMLHSVVVYLASN